MRRDRGVRREHVRAAEGAAMARAARGELMDRAARGLADVVAVRLRERGGAPRRRPRRRRGQRRRRPVCRRRARRGGRGRRGASPCRSTAHAAGLEAVTAAGVEVVASLGDAGGPARRRAGARGGRRARRRPRHRRPAGPAGPRPRPWSTPCRTTSMVIAVDLPSGADPAGEARRPTTVFADETVTFGDGQAGAPAAGRRSRRSGVLTVVDIGVEPVDGLPSVRAARPTTTWPPCGRCPDRRRQVLPRGARRRRRRRGLHRCAAAQRHDRRGGRRRDGPLRRARRPRPCSSAPPCPRRCTATDGCRRGWSAPDSTPTTTPRPAGPSATPRSSALASGAAVRRGRRRPRAARARAAEPRRPCSRRTPASWPGCSPGSDRPVERAEVTAAPLAATPGGSPS